MSIKNEYNNHNIGLSQCFSFPTCLLYLLFVVVSIRYKVEIPFDVYLIFSIFMGVSSMLAFLELPFKPNTFNNKLFVFSNLATFLFLSAHTVVLFLK